MLEPMCRRDPGSDRVDCNFSTIGHSNTNLHWPKQLTCIFPDNGHEALAREPAEDFPHSDGSHPTRGFREGNEPCPAKHRRNAGRRAAMSEKLHNSGKLSEEGLSAPRHTCIL